MRVTVLAVGQLKEKPYREMAQEYLKRLSRYGKYQVIEVPDLPEPASASPAALQQLKQREGEQLLRHVRPNDYLIALTIPGRQMPSPVLAQHLEALPLRVTGDVLFAIGGSQGLSDQVIARADEQLSMSQMTFPHQLARVMLLEQLYRSAKITAGERYHK
ncbi:MAG: 23S rRNA (pseudouridine(1915)-N(3))-methyltransferase RlmH [Clostridia bacterium]|nr:23S rRNA (pseudouridine(1915)-N(3))-methyltransferase RlmH [Clostridia bacterium]